MDITISYSVCNNMLLLKVHFRRLYVTYIVNYIMEKEDITQYTEYMMYLLLNNVILLQNVH